MYTDQELACATRRLKRHILITCAACVPLLASLIIFLILRKEIPSIACLTLLCCAFLFLLDMLILPVARYRSFILAVRRGLTRTVSGIFVSIANDTQLEDGATVRCVAIDPEDGTGTRLFYHDISRPLPAVAPGTKVELLTSGRHILSVKTV